MWYCGNVASLWPRDATSICLHHMSGFAKKMAARTKNLSSNIALRIPGKSVKTFQENAFSDVLKETAMSFHPAVVSCMYGAFGLGHPGAKYSK